KNTTTTRTTPRTPARMRTPTSTPSRATATTASARQGFDAASSAGSCSSPHARARTSAGSSTACSPSHRAGHAQNAATTIVINEKTPTPEQVRVWNRETQRLATKRGYRTFLRADGQKAIALAPRGGSSRAQVVRTSEFSYTIV